MRGSAVFSGIPPSENPELEPMDRSDSLVSLADPCWTTCPLPVTLSSSPLAPPNVPPATLVRIVFTFSMCCFPTIRLSGVIAFPHLIRPLTRHKLHPGRDYNQAGKACWPQHLCQSGRAVPLLCRQISPPHTLTSTCTLNAWGHQSIESQGVQERSGRT